MLTIHNEEVLNYLKKNKIRTDLIKFCFLQHGFSLVNTVGVVTPYPEIVKDSSLSFENSNRLNFLAVISDDTTVEKATTHKGIACKDSYDDEVYKEHLRFTIYRCLEENLQ